MKTPEIHPEFPDFQEFSDISDSFFSPCAIPLESGYSSWNFQKFLEYVGDCNIQLGCLNLQLNKLNLCLIQLGSLNFKLGLLYFKFKAQISSPKYSLSAHKPSHFLKEVVTQLLMAAIGGAVVVPIIIPVLLVTLAPIVICHVICLSLYQVVSITSTHGPRPYLHGSHVTGLRVSHPSSLLP